MSAHGSLGLGSPWTRALFPRETRTEVEALIPAGIRINVTTASGKSTGPWNLRAFQETPGDDRDIEVMAMLGRSDPRTACRVMALDLTALVAA